jgi:hypothetical protein
MTRRAWLGSSGLGISVAWCCRAADPAGEVLDLVSDAAASLSAGNAASFLDAFDKSMPGYAKLRENVTALLAMGDVKSIVEPVDDAGDDRRREVQFQWTLQILAGSAARATSRREQVVKCVVEKRGGKWRITKLEPVEFFAPNTGPAR